MKLDLDSQVRVRRLIAEKKIAAYERLNGEIGEIGVPRNRAGGGWVFGSPKREPMKVA